MPAVSKKQQKFFGIVRAIQKGDLAPTTPETAKAANDMKKSDVKKFASTKHKGLPEKKKLKETKFFNNKDIKPVFPKEAPPKLDKKTGMHPNYGKQAARYMKMDPISAKSMPPTGDKEIDKVVNSQVVKKKLKEELKLNRKISFPEMQKRIRDAKERAREKKKESDRLYSDTKKHGVKFYDKKGTGRIVGGKKKYD